MAITRANIISTEYTGNQSFDKRQNRSYFFIVFTATAGGTIEFGGGGGLIPIPLDGHFEPSVVPTGTIDIVTAGGTFIIAEG